jgi:hypothetical protein
MEYSLSQRLGSFVGKPFDPNDLENATLELWLNVYDGVYSGGTLFDPSAGAATGPVEAWADKSDNQFWLTQTTLNNRPTLDYDGSNPPYVSFDGSNDFLISTSDQDGLTAADFSITGDTPRTIIMVWRRDNNDQKWIVDWGNAGTGTRMGLTQEYFVRCSGSVTKDYTNVGTDNQYTITYLDGTGSDLDSYDLYVDGATTPTAAVSTTNGSTTLNTLLSQLTVGAFSPGTGGWADGRLQELMIYSDNPTASERAKLFEYLNNKYSVY